MSKQQKRTPETVSKPGVQTVHNKAPKTREPLVSDQLRINISIGLLTLIATAFALYLLNDLIYAVYKPDIMGTLKQVLPVALDSADSFAPEPVERLQFELSVLTLPFIIYGFFSLFNRRRSLFETNKSLPFAINIISIVLFIFFFVYLLNEKLRHVPDTTNAAFFEKTILGKIDPLLSVGLYAVVCYFTIVLLKQTALTSKKSFRMTVGAISALIVGIIAIDILCYNFFYLPIQSWDRRMETNAVLYSVTQVYAGKSLLVNINAQYGLYAWLLAPIFKIIGLSTLKFSIVMGLLNGASFVLFYLGIRKVVRQDIIALLVFLCVLFWGYLYQRLPLEATPHYYYQYPPIRILFPSLLLFLFTTYQSASANRQRFLLPIMAVLSSLAILWNSDSGVAVFGATFCGLIYMAFNNASLAEGLKKAMKNAVWMIGGLAFVILWFSLSTKMKSGEWPHFVQSAEYQSIFYISGFFMLPMSIVGFWYLPVLLYISGGVFGAYRFRKANNQEGANIVFLVILGLGLFTYFQGRSYDFNVAAVMYPAIIIAGFFCRKLLAYIETYDTYKLRFHEAILFFFLPFLFIMDGAFTSASNLPAFHSFSLKNAEGLGDAKPEPDAAEKIQFVTSHLHPKDTALIVAMNYDSYYYALGGYYNPVDIPGSTELFFKSQLYTLLDSIRTTRRPIIYDANHAMVYNPYEQYVIADTVIKTLAENTTIVASTSNRYMVLLKHGRDYKDQLQPDANTIFYEDYGVFNLFLLQQRKLALPPNFSIEFIISAEGKTPGKNILLFGNAADINKRHGIIVFQNGDNPYNFLFSYGNGTDWSNPASFVLDSTGDDHIRINVQNQTMTIYKNGVQCSQSPGKGDILNSDDPFIFGNFPGVIRELKISRL